MAKSVAWFLGGGSSLLAEAIHSLADIGNQAMLRFGIFQAAQAPTAQHPFGHMREKFIFRYEFALQPRCNANGSAALPNRKVIVLCSLISAVGIFCLGAGVSIVHGIHAIFHPVLGEANPWGIPTLVLATLVEGMTLVVAIRAVMAGARW